MIKSDSELIAPPPALLGSNPLRWLRYFGPGAIIASATVGTGETLFASRGGSIFGYGILWLFLYVCILKWVLCYSSMRHMILSGAHPYERWNHLPGPRGWFPLFMIVIIFLCFPIWYAFLSGVLGTIFKWIFGVQEAFQGFDKEIWATLAILVAMIILYIGNYEFLEKGQIVLIGTVLVCIVVSLFHLEVEWPAAFAGSALPRAMEYPEWLFEIKPDMKDRSVWLEIITYVGVIGGPTFDYLAYLSFLRNKRWGMSNAGIATEQQLSEMAGDEKHTARLWVKAAVIDTTCSFFMVAFLSACFSILGTVVLQADHLVPADEDLLNYQAQFLTTLAPWLEPLYKVAIFAAFITILFGGPEIAFRIFYEYVQSVPGLRRRVQEKSLRVAVVIWCLLGGMIGLWILAFFSSKTLVQFISPASVVNGALCGGLYCLLNPWMDWRFLPKRLRMGPIMLTMNILAGVLFLAMGLRALWDTWAWGDRNYLIYVCLVIFVAVIMVLAHLLRGLHREDVQSIEG